MNVIWIFIAAFWLVNAVRAGIGTVKLTKATPIDSVAVSVSSNEVQISLLWILISLLMMGK